MQIRHQCSGWSSDYARLKEYRCIRNQISHDDGAYEDDLCTIEDEQWLQKFHACLLSSNDPVALYFKSQRAAASHPKQTTPTSPTRPSTLPQSVPTKHPKQPVGCAVCFVMITMITMAVGRLVLHM